MPCNPSPDDVLLSFTSSLNFSTFREKTSIISMINIAGSDEETISFSKAVKATGNIEDWLGALEKGMQVGETDSTCREKEERMTCHNVHTAGFTAVGYSPMISVSYPARYAAHQATIMSKIPAQMFCRPQHRGILTRLNFASGRSPRFPDSFAN